jgi:hypothetical protein
VQFVVQLGVTVNGDPLLATPDTVTTTFPVVAPAGTVTVMLVALQALAAAAVVPLKVTVLDPCGVPKFVPVIVIGVPTGPEVWLSVVMVGGAVITRVNVLFEVAGVGTAVSVTSTMMFVKVPAVVGVPEITPWLLLKPGLLLLRLKPAGSGLDVLSRLNV